MYKYIYESNINYQVHNIIKNYNKPSILNDIYKWIDIPTYDNKGEVTHPKVLYFNKAFNGYKYWMVMTPYPFNDASKENPSIVVSNDGINWVEPSGIKNPVSGVPKSKNDDAYYSDPYLLFDNDHFELFYRKTMSYSDDKYIKNGFNYIYRQISYDGINWSKKELILDNNLNENYMSISVVKDNNNYKIWYVNYDGKVRYIESDNLINFSNPIDVSIKEFNKKVWHGEVQYIDGRYISIFMIKYKLFYSESKDGINFDEPKVICTNIPELKGKNSYIYKSSFIISDKYVELFIPYRVDYVWEMRYSKIPKDKFYIEINRGYSEFNMKGNKGSKDGRKNFMYGNSDNKGQESITVEE